MKDYEKFIIRIKEGNLCAGEYEDCTIFDDGIIQFPMDYRTYDKVIDPVKKFARKYKYVWVGGKDHFDFLVPLPKYNWLLEYYSGRIIY